MNSKNKHPQCGGQIVAEAICEYGQIFYIKKEGTVGRKLKERKYKDKEEFTFDE